MEVDIKNKCLIVKHRLLKNETYRIKDGPNFKSISIYKKGEKTQGVSSICEDHKHTLYLDFDHVKKEIVIKDLELTQQREKITPFMLFTTKEEIINGETIGNYHAVSLTKFYPAKIIEIQSLTHCDSNYTTMPKRSKYRSWVLRCAWKGKREPPKYLGIIGKIENLDKEVSQAHLLFFKTVYPELEDIPYKNLDGFKTVDGQRYETLNF